MWIKRKSWKVKGAVDCYFHLSPKLEEMRVFHPKVFFILFSTNLVFHINIFFILKPRSWKEYFFIIISHKGPWVYFDPRMKGQKLSSWIILGILGSIQLSQSLILKLWSSSHYQNLIWSKLDKSHFWGRCRAVIRSHGLPYWSATVMTPLRNIVSWMLSKDL